MWPEPLVTIEKERESEIHRHPRNISAQGLYFHTLYLENIRIPFAEFGLVHFGSHPEVFQSRKLAHLRAPSR